MPPKGHAILSASSSDRWLHCPPSARLCETYEDKGSDYAAEGTDAHELCEYKLKRALGMNAADPTENLSWYNEEMEECANGYASYILEQVEAAKETCSDPKVLIEQRVDFSRWVEEGFGTADCIIIADGTLRICDYKHGLGVLVSAEDTNKCSMLFIRDEDIKVAFATVLNKLIYGHNLVLKPYLQASKHNSNDANILRIQQLESLLEQNAEQRETLHKLMGQGYIDQILYTQENNALLSQADGYRQDIEVLNQFMSGSSTRIYETERLLHFCEHEDMLKEYDENLFEIFVDHIEVYSRNEIGFVMKCGLTLKEMI